LAHELVLEVYGASRGFPDGERYGLTAQLRRSAVSVAANIVEGSGRFSEREFDRYLEIAFGSLRETGYYLLLARDLGYLDDGLSTRLNERQGRAAAALTSLMRRRRSFTRR
jgi:four helix bundle protein